MKRRIFSLIVLLLLPVYLLQAQEKPRWYEVEVILFKQWQAPGEDAEQWPTDAAEPTAARSVQLGEGNGAYSKLSPQALKLHGIFQELEQSKSYQPLLHVGWRQPGLSKAEAAAVALPQGWTPAPADTVATGSQTPPLHGLITVFEERFLHAAVDLHHHEGGDAAIVSADGRHSGAPIIIHRQQRRIRNAGELNYLDHPALGAIIQIRPIAPPDSGSTAAAPNS